MTTLKEAVDIIRNGGHAKRQRWCNTHDMPMNTISLCPLGDHLPPCLVTDRFILERASDG